MTTKFAGTMAAALVAGAATAATPTVLQNDGSRGGTYWTDSAWSPAVAPGNANAANYDFIVKNGKVFWIGYDAASGGEKSNKVMTFPGASLQLGAEDFSSAGNMNCKGDNSTWTFNDLRLYKGYISNASNGSFTYKGQATVYSKADEPFNFSFRGDKTSYCYMRFTGNEDNVLRISHATSGDGANVWVLFYGDQSQTYSGAWVIDANAHFRPTTLNETGCNIRTSAQVFGKPLATFNPAALTMKACSIMRYEAADRNFAASDNRGLTLDAPGSHVTYMIINDNGHSFSWPITGQGTFRIQGWGSFYLYSSCSVPIKVDDVSTRFYLCSGASATGGFSDSAGRPINVLGRVNDGSVGTVRIGGTIPAGQKIALGLDKMINVTTTTDVPLVVIDKNVSRTLTEADFDPWGVPSYQIVNAEKVVFSTNGDGDTVVSVRLFPYISSKGNNPRLNNGGTWESGSVPVAGNNYYVVAGTEFRTGANDGTTVSVPGNIWVFGSNSSYNSKEGRMTFPFCRLLDGVTFNMAQSYDGTWEYAGNVDIRQTFGQHVNFSAGGLRGCRVSANLSGNGTIWTSGSSRSYHYNDIARPVFPHWIEFSGNNSGYVGTFFATNTSYVAEAGPLQLKAASETNFGGNPEKFSANAWAIGHGVVFMPTADVTFDDANRGVTFLAGSFVNTTSGDFAIKTPVVFEGAFAKDGTGTFAFGAGGATFGTGAAIAVNAGALKAEGVNAIKGAAVSFADGAVLAFDATVGAVDLTTTTLSKAGEKYLVRIDGLQEETAIATFASAQAAADFVANAKTVKGSAHKGYLFADGATVKAGVPGVVVIFR